MRSQLCVQSQRTGRDCAATHAKDRDPVFAVFQLRKRIFLTHMNAVESALESRGEAINSRVSLCVCAHLFTCASRCKRPDNMHGIGARINRYTASTTPTSATNDECYAHFVCWCELSTQTREIHRHNNNNNNNIIRRT